MGFVGSKFLSALRSRKPKKLQNIQMDSPVVEGWQAIFAISYAPSNPSIVYFGTDCAQIWKSVDGGITWKRRSNGLGTNGAMSLAIDPKNTDVVYASGSIFAYWPDFPDTAEGIYRTIDGGANWTRVHKAHFHGQTYGRSGGNHIVFAGSNLYAGQSTGGILKSANGISWSLLAKSGGGYVLDTVNIWDMKVHPANNTNIYVSASDGLYKVTDNGGSATLTKIGAGLPVGAISSQIQIDRTNPNVMYSFLGGQGVYRSTDGGYNFTARNNGLPVPLTLAGGLQKGSLAISPVDPNRLIVAFPKWDTRGLVYYTNNGGLSWTQTDGMDERNLVGWVAGSINSLFGASGGGTTVTPIAFHPTNREVALITAFPEIIKRTNDGGRTWEYSNSGYTGSWNSKNVATPIGWDVSAPGRAAFTHHDFGTMVTLDNEDTFTNVSSIIKYRGRGDTAAAAMRGNLIIKGVGKPNQEIAISRDAGSQWSLIAGADATDGFNLIEWHPQNSNVVYADQYKFTNILINTNFITLPRKIAAVFKDNGNIVYAHNGATISKSTDGGVNWTTPYPSLNLPLGKGIAQIAIDPTNENRIYVAVKGIGIYIITNTAPLGGYALLKNDAHGLKKDQFGQINIWAVTVDPLKANVVYAGSRVGNKGYSNGIFRSVDNGNSWVNINGNLGSHLDVSNIAVNPYTRYVYISSAIGTWKLPPP